MRFFLELLSHKFLLCLLSPRNRVRSYLHGGRVNSLSRTTGVYENGDSNPPPSVNTNPLRRKASKRVVH
jgi:hypothetical protein